MQRIHDQNPQIAVILVNGGEPADVARPYYQEHMLTVTIALDEADRVSRAYHVSAIPTSVFIDAQGIVRKVYVGVLTEAMIREGLAAASAASPP